MFEEVHNKLARCRILANRFPSCIGTDLSYSSVFLEQVGNEIHTNGTMAWQIIFLWSFSSLGLEEIWSHCEANYSMQVGNPYVLICSFFWWWVVVLWLSYIGGFWVLSWHHSPYGENNCDVCAVSLGRCCLDVMISCFPTCLDVKN